jgi:hypothetical protein
MSGTNLLAPPSPFDPNQLSGNPLAAGAPTLADAWTANAKAYSDWVAQQKAAGIAAGTIDPSTGWPTQAGYLDAARQTAGGLLMGTTAPEMKAPIFRQITDAQRRKFFNPRDPSEAKYVLPDGRLLGTGDNTHEYIANTLGYGFGDDGVNAMLADTGAARVNAGIGAGSTYGDIHIAGRPTDPQMRQLAKIVNGQPETGVAYNGDYQTVRNGADLRRLIDASSAAPQPPPAGAANPLATGAATPQAPGLGLDSAAMKVLADMQPAGITAYHGSPHSFDQFSTDAVGTGEGAQAYGHGLYFAENEGTARSYRDALAAPQFDGGPYDYDNIAHRAAYYLDRFGGDRGATLEGIDAEDANFAKMLSKATTESSARIYTQGRQRLAEIRARLADPTGPTAQITNPGNMYQVNIAADPATFLDWDTPRDQLPPNVQTFAKQNYPTAWDNAADGSSLYQGMVRQQRGEYVGTTKPDPSQAAALVSQALHQAGIPGIRYLDQGSRRGGGAGTRNYVVFDAKTIGILRKYGIAGLLAGGAATGATSSQQ